MSDRIVLKAHGWEVEIASHIGASITRCAYKGQDVLRPVTKADFTAEDTGCFPLVPFSNRIENGTFEFDSVDVKLPANVKGQAHPLHGFGWQAQWDIVTVTPASCELSFDYAGGDWPWPFQARYVFGITEQGFMQTLSLQNRSDVLMPVGLGFHPYFFGNQDTKLQFNSKGIWRADNTVLPTKFENTDLFERARSVVSSNYDNCFSGWDGNAQITWPNQNYRLQMSANANCNHAVLYSPPNEKFFCLEPVTHMNNALSGRYPKPYSNAHILRSNESYMATMHFSMKRVI